MSITTSQQSAFEDAILNLIAAEMIVQGEPGVQVSIGPLGDDSAQEFIQSVGGPSTQDWAAIGNGRKREELELTLMVYAASTGGGADSIRAARDRAEFFVSVIEIALREGVSVPTVGPIRHVQVDAVTRERIVSFQNSDDRAEIWQVTITGLADLYRT